MKNGGREKGLLAQKIYRRTSMLKKRPDHPERERIEREIEELRAERSAL